MTDALRYSPAGAQRDGALTLPETTFDGTVNEAALYRAVVAFRNNQRQGTHKVKSRSEVSGGNQKPWRQKGTGRARQGTTRAPHWRGGGIVFGPTPRDYTTSIPRKLKALARKSALKHLVDTFFDGSAEKAVAALLGGEATRVTGEELDRIADLIAKARIAELAQKARKDGAR